MLVLEGALKVGFRKLVLEGGFGQIGPDHLSHTKRRASLCSCATGCHARCGNVPPARRGRRGQTTNPGLSTLRCVRKRAGPCSSLLACGPGLTLRQQTRRWSASFRVPTAAPYLLRVTCMRVVVVCVCRGACEGGHPRRPAV